MKHISEDNLLHYVLETIPTERELLEIKAHLAECVECQDILSKIQNDIGIICGINPKVHNIIPPKQKRRFINKYAFLKVAALFLFGLFVGLGISGRTDQEIVFISPAYMNQSPPADSLFGYAIPDATQMSLEYSGSDK